MVFINLGLEHISDLLLNRLHFSTNIVSRLVLRFIGVCLTIELSHHVIHLVVHILVDLLEIHLLIVETLVLSLRVSFALLALLVDSGVELVDTVLETVIFPSYDSHFFLDLSSSSIFEQIDVVFELLDGVFQLFERFFMSWEVEIRHRIVVEITIDELGFQLVDLLQEHSLGVVEEVDVTVHFLVQL